MARELERLGRQLRRPGELMGLRCSRCVAGTRTSGPGTGRPSGTELIGPGVFPITTEASWTRRTTGRSGRRDGARGAGAARARGRRRAGTVRRSLDGGHRPGRAEDGCRVREPRWPDEPGSGRPGLRDGRARAREQRPRRDRRGAVAARRGRCRGAADRDLSAWSIAAAQPSPGGPADRVCPRTRGPSRVGPNRRPIGVARACRCMRIGSAARPNGSGVSPTGGIAPSTASERSLDSERARAHASGWGRLRTACRPTGRGALMRRSGSRGTIGGPSHGPTARSR